MVVIEKGIEVTPADVIAHYVTGTRTLDTGYRTVYYTDGKQVIDLATIVKWDYTSAMHMAVLRTNRLDQREGSSLPLNLKRPVVTTKDCPRCGGSGMYSYCERFGRTCFQCGGQGIVPCAPDGQAKIPTTADDIRKATIGDIVSVNCVLYQVLQVKWMRVQRKDWNMFNQSVTVIRLVDEKKLYFKREAAAPDWDAFARGECSVNGVTGEKSPMHKVVVPTDEMIGQPVDLPLPVYDVIEEIDGYAVVKIEEKFALRVRNENDVLVYVPGCMKEYARQSGAVKKMKEIIDGR